MCKDGDSCLWNNSLCWPIGHNSAENRGRDRFWSCLAAAHSSFWLMHHHVFLHCLVTQKQIKSPARWAAPLLRLGCKRGCLCQIRPLFWTRVNCCVTISLWICLGTTLQLPLLLLFYLEWNSRALSWTILSVLPLWHFAWERDESQAKCHRLHALSSWVWIRGKGSGITGDCLPEHLTESWISQGWRLLWPPGHLGPALRGMSSSVLLCQLGEKPVRSAWPVKL